MNTPLASSASVAELAIGYMFMLARSLYKATATMKAEKWEKKAFEGDEMGGKTLGLIGVGNIGRRPPREPAPGHDRHRLRSYVKKRRWGHVSFRWMNCWPRPITSACTCPRPKNRPE